MGRDSSVSQPLPSGPRRPAGAAGFTLVEILTALLVLMIALSGVIGLLYGSFQHGRMAADRSAAAILIPEALRNIAQSHYKVDTGTYEPLTAAGLVDKDSARYSMGGGYYVFRYRLTRFADTDENYSGLCALTVVCYRDTEGDPAKQVPISDPVTVYLRERQ